MDVHPPTRLSSSHGTTGTALSNPSSKSTLGAPAGAVVGGGAVVVVGAAVVVVGFTVVVVGAAVVVVGFAVVVVAFGLAAVVLNLGFVVRPCQPMSPASAGRSTEIGWALLPEAPAAATMRTANAVTTMAAARSLRSRASDCMRQQSVHHGNDLNSPFGPFSEPGRATS